MAQQWVSVVEAAAALKVHTRTIERHTKSGKLPCRRADDGQVQVCIDLPDPPTTGPDPLSVVAGQAENQVQLALGTTSAIVRSAQEDARLARQDAEQAWDETYVARRNSRNAWAVVGVMVVGTMVAIGWCAASLTKAGADVQSARDKAGNAQQQADQLSDEAQRLHSELNLQQQRSARAEGELAGRTAADAQQVGQLSDDNKRLHTELNTQQQRTAKAEAELADRPAANAGQQPGRATGWERLMGVITTSPGNDPKNKN